MTRLLPSLSVLSLSLLGLLLAGCGLAAEPTPSQAPVATAPNGQSLPARPREIRLDGLDPCRLLTAEQQRRLNPDQPPTANYGDRGPSCQWGRGFTEPREGYLVRLRTNLGADQALAGPPGVRVVSVAGFGAVETFGQPADPDRTCILAIDVADGQSVDVLYDYTGKALPINRALACQRAATAADLVMQTLLAQVR